MKYAFGAYGTNNLGDEAIYEGLCQEIGPAIQIYVNKSSVPLSIWYADLLKGKISFDPDAEELIIGGGGLFHSKNAIIDYIRMADLAIKNHMKVSIQGVGVEGINNSFQEDARELCKRCYFISVRSKQSQLLLESLGFKSTVRKDFAYNIQSEESVMIPEFENKLPIIGFITGGCGDELAISKLSQIIRKFTVGEDLCNFIHIPHSKSFVNYTNNDVVTGELLWSNIDIYHANRENSFKTYRFLNNPRQLLSLYQQLDGVIGARYHSFIFSEMAGKPLLGLVSGRKAKSYFEDRPQIQCIDFDKDINEIITKVKMFINFLR